MTPTRFAELGYEQHGPKLWRVVTTDTGSAVGPQYATKAELLADLERYAADYGCALAHKPVAENAAIRAALLAIVVWDTPTHPEHEAMIEMWHDWLVAREREPTAAAVREALLDNAREALGIG